MSELKPIHTLSREQIEAISGGLDCSPETLQSILDGLQQNYETLIDFTVYVMERVSGTGG